MENYREDFPLLKNRDIAYLDSGATTQKPQYVLDKLNELYPRILQMQVICFLIVLNC